MDTKVVTMETATFEQWQRIGHVERLATDQEIAAFLIHIYSENKEQLTPALLCCHCQAPLVALCDACRPTLHPSQPPPPQSAHNPSSPASDSGPLSEIGQHRESDQSQARMSLSTDQSQARMSLSTDQSQARMSLSNDQSQARLKQSCDPDQPQTKLKLTYESDQSQARSNVSNEFDQPKSRSSLWHQSDQSQARSNLSPDQSETRSSSGTYDNSQSQTSTEAPASLPSCIDQSQLHSGLSTNQNPQPGLPEKLGVVRNSAVSETGVKSFEPSDFGCGLSRHTQQAPRGVCVKEERRDNDDDDDDHSDEEVACEKQRLSSSQDGTSQTKGDEEEETVSIADVEVCGSRPCWGQEGGGRRWGAMETGAVRWVLSRYHLHTPASWEDCALLLNTALATSATGEEWRKLALEKNLLSAKNIGSSHVDDDDDDAAVDALPRNQSGAASTTQLPRARCKKSRVILDSNTEPQEPKRTRSRVKRSRDLSSSQTEPQDASSAVSGCSQKAGKGRTLRQSRRPGLRSSGRMLKENAAASEEAGGEATHPIWPARDGERKGVAPLEDARPIKAEAATWPADNWLEETLPSGEEDDEEPSSKPPSPPSPSPPPPPPPPLSSSSSPPPPSSSSSSPSSSPPPPSSSSPPPPSSSSQKTEEVSDSPDAHASPPSSSSAEDNKPSWHYLGAADVGLPDVTQKRKSFKRSPNDRYQCKDCRSCFTHRGILVKHIRLAHLKWRPHACGACPAAYASKSKLERHVNAAHRNLRPFRCEACGAAFVDRSTLLAHGETHRRDREYGFFCELCGKGYYGMRELRRHMETHATRPTRSLLCWVCGKAVRTTQYLRIHMRTHSPEKAFRCGECGHVFTSKCALGKHRASRACGKKPRRPETTLPPVIAGQPRESRKKRLAAPPRLAEGAERKTGRFQCDLCDKLFSAKKNVYKHKRSVHGLEAKRDSDARIVLTDPAQLARYVTPKSREAAALKFSCDLCCKRYSSQESVRKHKNIVHLGRRDYKCDVCGKTFTRHTSVIEHKHNVHNPAGKPAQPPAQCQICHKTFAAKNSLRKHVKTVHFGLLPFACRDCGKKFASRYHLREHLKSSGHRAPVVGEKGEGGGGGEASVASIHTAPLPATTLPTPAPKLHAATVTSPSLTSLSTLPPLPPWAPLPPTTGAVTPLQALSLDEGEVRSGGGSSGAEIRGVQSFHLWNMG